VITGASRMAPRQVAPRRIWRTTGPRWRNDSLPLEACAVHLDFLSDFPSDSLWILSVLSPKCYYQMQLQRGKGRHAAFRALAFKWQRIMWRCWQNHTLYDDTKYVESLKRDSNELYAILSLAGLQCRSLSR
jgi:hypothetical protein